MTYDWTEIKSAIDGVIEDTPFFTIKELLDIIGIKKGERSSFFLQTVRKYLHEKKLIEQIEATSIKIGEYNVKMGSWYKPEEMLK